MSLQPIVAFRHIGDGLRRHGARAFLRKALYLVSSRVQARAFDLRHGVRTSGRVELDRLTIRGEHKAHGVHYQSSRVGIFRQTMKRFQVPVTGHFVDIGCGKGRTLMLAAEYGFRNVVGLEFSVELSQEAQANLTRHFRRKNTGVQHNVICIDAAEYHFHPAETVFYLYNPFDEVIMRKVLANLRASLEAAPRRVDVIYANPVHRQVFDNDSFWNLEATYDSPVGLVSLLYRMNDASSP